MITKPFLNQRGWEVEWCANVPIDENGDQVLDAADYRREYYATKAEAEARAREVYPHDWFGSVAIRESIFDPWDDGYPGGRWEAMGDADYYDGPA